MVDLLGLLPAFSAVACLTEEVQLRDVLVFQLHSGGSLQAALIYGKIFNQEADVFDG